MLFSTPLGENGSKTLVVALGSEGVLVRTPEAVWEQHGVQGAQPTADRAMNLDEAYSVIQNESALPWLFAPIVFVMAIGSSWSFLLQALRDKNQPAPSWNYVATPFVSSIFEVSFSLRLLFSSAPFCLFWVSRFCWSCLWVADSVMCELVAPQCANAMSCMWSAGASFALVSQCSFGFCHSISGALAFSRIIISRWSFQWRQCLVGCGGVGNK